MYIKKIILGVVMASFVSFVNASDGLKTVTSQHDVSETTNRLESIVKAAEFRVFARIDHSGAAQRVDISLRPTQLLIFGKPKLIPRRESRAHPFANFPCEFIDALKAIEISFS